MSCLAKLSKKKFITLRPDVSKNTIKILKRNKKLNAVLVEPSVETIHYHANMTM